MRQSVCAYCGQKFRPCARHPHQRACSSTKCQRRRRADYHREKVATDSEYREQCRDSRKKWRDRNANHITQYDKDYRARKQALGSRDADRSHVSYQVRRLAGFLNNDTALDLHLFGENVLLVFPPSLPSAPLGRHPRWQPQMIWWRARAQCPKMKNEQECRIRD